MSQLVNAHDNYTPTQYGEKGHIEYGWSNNIQEKILQLNFQLTRTDTDKISKLSIIIYHLLVELKYYIEKGSLLEKEVAKGHLSILYRMIGFTRDIIDGKGEYTLSYMMVYTWYKIYPKLAEFALKCFFTLDKKDIHQYGSWKDFKYFCEYCKSQGDTVNSPIILYAISLINEQIKIDYANMISNSNYISLAAKWVPREKSSFGWLYESLATDYFSQYLTTANTDERLMKATLKCKCEYRKLISSLNRQIDTTQIKQCGGIWQSIDFNNVTSITLTKQKKAFLNINKNGEVRCPDSSDRIQCATNFQNIIQKVVKEQKEIKGKRVGMADFTKQAIDLLRSGIQSEKDLLNLQWCDNSSQNGMLDKMIAMVDVSGSMEGEPLNVAIALGIRIAEKSVLGKRVMTFSSKPTWVNLDPYPDFISQVEIIKHAEWGMNTNFYAALNMILDVIVENKMAPEDVQDLTLVILSDMQIDDGDKCNKNILYDTIKEKYEGAGIRVHGVPYKPPHIFFWNLRSTNGFPSLSNQLNTYMMSGFSPTLLNLFCEQGLDALQSCTPWSLLIKSLDNKRYKIMSNKFEESLV